MPIMCAFTVWTIGRAVTFRKASVMLLSAAPPPDCQYLSMYLTMFFSSQSAVATPPVQMHVYCRSCGSSKKTASWSYEVLTMPIIYTRIEYPVIQVAFCLSQTCTGQLIRGALEREGISMRIIPE